MPFSPSCKPQGPSTVGQCLEADLGRGTAYGIIITNVHSTLKSICPRLSHCGEGRERHRWEPQVAEGSETFLRLWGLWVSWFRIEGPVKEFIPQGKSRYIVFPLSSFSGLFLCTQKGEGRKMVGVKW